MDLSGKVAIVTGGGTGIGRATCEALAEHAAAGLVLAYSRSQTVAEEAARVLSASGCSALAMSADVTQTAAVERLVEHTVQRFGRLDLLINCAGVTEWIPFPDLDAATDAVWDLMLDVNVKGAFRCVRSAAPYLRAARGAVINVGSTAGLFASGSSIPYGVAKAALHHLTRSLAVAMAPEVRVNAIAPGTTTTRWYRERAGDSAADAAERATEASTPLRGVASPRDCAQAILGLLSSDWVTGQVVVVDGGKHLLYG